jgi:hypothetical protein
MERRKDLKRNVCIKGMKADKRRKHSPQVIKTSGLNTDLSFHPEAEIIAIE